jgi:hypothetical protein
MDTKLVERALAALRRGDPAAADHAEAVYGWVAGDEGIESISLSRVQRFAWYDLPVKWRGTEGEILEILDAGALLFDALNLAMYATVFRSVQTADILDAHARSHDEGLRAFQKAFDASGIEPADLDDFVWGDMMAREEAMAHTASEKALEMALTDGRLRPGTRGWRMTAAVITEDVLDSPHPEQPGQTWRTSILTERIHSRLRTLEGRSPKLHKLLSDTVNRLLVPIPQPPDLDLRLEPISWFLDYANNDVRMTDAGYLPTAMVRSAADRFGWDKGWCSDPPQKESDSSELMTLHELLLGAKAVRHRKGNARVTETGRRMLEDPEYAWRTIADSLTSNDWTAAVAEAFTLLMLNGGKNAEDLTIEALALLVECGWRADDTPPDVWNVRHTWWSVRRPLDVLGGFTESGQLLSRTATLTPFGEATLLERLRLDVTGPMRHI